MLRVSVKILLVLSLLFILIVTAICAHPYDGSELQAFIQPAAGCTNPCMMGIEIGVTTPSDAVAILRANPWVDEVVAHPPDYHWTWSKGHPAFIRGDEVGRLGIGGDGVVQGVEFMTTIPFGDLWETFGPPDRQDFTTFMNALNPLSMEYLAGYSNQQFTLLTQVNCRTDFVRRDFWQAEAMLMWTYMGSSTDRQDNELTYGLNHQYWIICYSDLRGK